MCHVNHTDSRNISNILSPPGTALGYPRHDMILKQEVDWRRTRLGEDKFDKSVVTERPVGDSPAMLEVTSQSTAASSVPLLQNDLRGGDLSTLSKSATTIYYLLVDDQRLSMAGVRNYPVAYNNSISQFHLVACRVTGHDARGLVNLWSENT